MVNLFFWIFTTVVYSLIWYIAKGNFYEGALDDKFLKKFALCALLCAPFNVNGNVFTIFGNGYSEKNIYSVFSLYQEAENNSFALLSSGYQSARKNVMTSIGISVYQSAGLEAVTVFGASGYQRGKAHAQTTIGISVYQSSNMYVATPIGISLYQNAGYHSLAGIVIYQRSQHMTEAVLSGFQKVKGKERFLGILSKLQAD